MNRMYSPAPMVRSSRVPLYMQGFPPELLLGQDDVFDFDFTPPEPIIPDPVFVDVPPPLFSDVPFIAPTTPSFFPSGSPVLQPLIDQGFTRNEAQLISSAAASGHISEAQWNSILGGNHSHNEIANLIFGAGRTAAQIAAGARAGNKPALGPGSAPRVATPPPAAAGSSFFTQESIKGIPNWVLFAGGGFLLFGAMGKR